MAVNSRKISVILPFFNAEPYIEFALLSILKQGPIVKEIIAVNDGSTDRSSDIVSGYARKYPELVLRETSHRGPSCARNCGLMASTASLIYFADADDIVEPNALYKLFNMMEEHGTDISIGLHSQIKRSYAGHHLILKRDGINESVVMNQKSIYQYLENYCKFSRHYSLFEHCWNRLYKKDVIVEQDIWFPEAIDQLEDVHFNFSYLKYCRLASVVCEATYRHRLHQGEGRLSISSGQSPDSVKNTLFGLAPVGAVLEKLSPYSSNAKLMQSLIGSKMINHLARLCLSAKLGNCWETLGYINNIKRSKKFRTALRHIYLAGDESKILLALAKINAPALSMIIFMKIRRVVK
jgi:glycosyltransferase involved in cell wall biosynthesis